MAGLRGGHDAAPGVQGRVPHRAARSDLAAAFQRWIAAIRDGLQAMQGRGELREDADVPKLACALMAAVEGGLLLAKAQRDVAPLEAALDTVIDRIASLTA